VVDDTTSVLRSSGVSVCKLLRRLAGAFPLAPPSRVASLYCFSKIASVDRFTFCDDAIALSMTWDKPVLDCAGRHSQADVGFLYGRLQVPVISS
jgi:hypothetical protein